MPNSVASSQDNDAFGLIGSHDREALQFTALTATRDRVDDIVSADHQSDIHTIELGIDLTGIHDLLIGHARFSQKYIHMPWEAPGYRMNCKARCYLPLGQ